MCSLFEKAHFDIPDANPAEVLAYLMEEHDLKPADLALEMGSQSVVRDVLRKRRKINVTQAKALGERFFVSAATFL